MKKIIIITSLLITIAVVITSFVSVQKNKAEKPVNKEINLAISSINNYSSAAYNDAKASVHVIITKVNGSKQTVVLDRIFSSMQLNQVPTNGNAFNSKVIIPNVFNNKEKLVVSYTILYDSRGSVIEFCNDKVASDKSNKEKIDINI